MPPILDVAIGTVFVFLLFSLVVSALNELILSKFDQRAKFLHMGLQELFGATNEEKREWRRGFWHSICGGLLTKVKVKEADTSWTSKLYKHGLINALSRTDGPEGTSPSYIPAGAFVTALLDLIRQLPEPEPDAEPDDEVAATFQSRLKSWLKKITDQASQRLADPKAKEQTEEKLRASLEMTARTLQEVVNASLADQDNRRAFEQQIAAATDPDTPPDPAALLKVAQKLQTALRFPPSGTAHSAENIEKWIIKIAVPSKLRESLLSLFHSVDGDVEKFKAAVEGWFNATMDRVTGWYKRFSQRWMIAIGFILAAILNVDTIHIVQELAKSPNLAKAVAAQAASYAGTARAPQTLDELEKARKATSVRLNESKADLKIAQADFDDATNAVEPLQKALEEVKANRSTEAVRIEKQQALDTANEQLQAAIKKLADAQNVVQKATDDADTEAKWHAAVNQLSSTGIPIGWQDKAQLTALGINDIEAPGPALNWWNTILYYPTNYVPPVTKHLPHFVPMLFGWFLTALAASLGAPFWFDTLNRFVNIRNAGRPPGEKDATSTPNKPPPANLDTAPH